MSLNSSLTEIEQRVESLERSVQSLLDTVAGERPVSEDAKAVDGSELVRVADRCLDRLGLVQGLVSDLSREVVGEPPLEIVRGPG